jgi:hypothetical protein
MSRAIFGRLAFAAIISLNLGFLSGCGSNSPSAHSTHPLVAVSLSAGGATGNAVTLNQGQTLEIVAVVANDPANAGVQWSVSGGGSLSSKTATSVTYTAPSPLSAVSVAMVTATSIDNSSVSSSLQINVDPPISISLSPSATQTICVNQTIPVTATVLYDPNNAGVQWSMLPTGSQNGTLTNQTATSAVYNPRTGIFTQDGFWTPGGANVIATSVTDPALTAQVSILVNPLLSYDGPFPAATFTQPYSFTLPNPACGVPPFTWSVVGTLPPGLTLNGNVISGAPTYPGSSSFGLKITDSQAPVPNTAQSSSSSAQIALNLPTVLTILTSSLPQGGVGANYSQTLVATAGSPPYTWSLASGSLPAGLSVNGATGIISGVPTTASTNNFTVKITDSATPTPNTATAALSIVIQPPLTLTTTSLPSGSKGTAYAQQLQASGGLPPYTFVLSSGTLPAGLTINESPAYTGVIAGVPTATGTSNSTISIKDSQGFVGSGTLSIEITAADCPNNSSLSGSYAFLLSGPNYDVAPTFYNYVGSFTADGAGNITQGYVDSQSTFSSGTPGTLGGTYCIGADSLGTATLNGLPGSSIMSSNILEIALQSGGNGSWMIYQNAPVNGTGLLSLAISGVILKQDTSAFSTGNINGNYAFGLLDSAGFSASEVGGFTADGAGNVRGLLDFSSSGIEGVPTIVNDAAVTASNLVVSSTGRGTVTLNTSVTEFTSLPVIFYVVNSSQLLALENIPNAQVLAGEILQQSGTPYGSGSLSGVSVMAGQQYDASGNPLVQAGLMTWDGAGNLNWMVDQNDAGTMSTQNYDSTYTVGSYGRVSIVPSGCLSDCTPTAVLYLSAPNQGFLSGNVVFGTFANQSGNSFSNSSLSGSYTGDTWQQFGNANLQVEQLSFDGEGSVTGTSDSDAPLQVPFGPMSTPISGTYAVSSNGRGTITQSGATTWILYVVSPTQVLMIPNSDSNPAVTELSH